MENENTGRDVPANVASGFDLGLSGGAKAGYFALGLFLTLVGVLIAYLMNRDKPAQTKKDAMKFAVIGLVVEIVLAIVMMVAFYGYLMQMVGVYGAM